MTDEDKFKEFMEWDRHRNSALTIAFAELDQMLNLPSSNRADGVMSVSAFRVLAKALIALRERVG